MTETENDFTGRLTTTELRRWRELNKITQKQMAEWLGTSRPTYLRFENNLHRKAPRDMGLEIRASELTGIPVNELHHKYIRRKAAIFPQNQIVSFDTARAVIENEIDTISPFPHYLKDTFFGWLLLDKVRRRKRRRERQWSDFWGGEKEITSLPEWQKIELDIVEWAAIFEALRQQRRKSHKKSVTSPRNFKAEIKDAIEKGKPLTPVLESIWQRRKSHKKSVISPHNSEAEVKDAIEDYLSSKPLTVLKYNRLDRFWSQQKVATEIGISQSQYSRIEKKSKATDSELDKLERLFGISKKGLFWPWYTQGTNPYRLKTGEKNQPEGRRHLSPKERVDGRLSFKESHHPKVPWYELRFWLLVSGLSPFRVLMMTARGDVSELLFRGR